jgi:hypothetical protein
VEEAIAEYKEVLRINKDSAAAHYNLGRVLYGKGDADGAIAEFKEALRLKPDDPEAHCNLGAAFQLKGQFAEALVYRRRGHELGVKTPGWHYPSEQWVKEAEGLVELDGKLRAILSGQEPPAGAAERLALAQHCEKYKRDYPAAARLYAAAFAAAPKLAADLRRLHRYDAACAAALAGRDAGEDAAKLTNAERAGFREQALDWLRADLDAWRAQLDKGPDKTLPPVAEAMQHWLEDADFNGVRGPEALAKLPEAEREPWSTLWTDVAATLARAQEKGKPEPKKAPPIEGSKKP